MTRFPTLLLFLLFAFCRLSAQTDSLSNVFERPQFPGGDRAFSIFWSDNFQVPLKYRVRVPENEGLLRFDVSKSGKINNIRVLKSLDPVLDEAALSAVRKMPDWKPALHNGQPVDAYVEIPYFILYENALSKIVTQEKRDSSAKPGGFLMNLWAGPMICTGDFGQYFNPVRFTLGMEIAYRRKALELGLGWDILAVSKVKKPFVLDQKDIVVKDQMSPIHVYFTVGYWFETPSKWAFSPFLAPTLNHIDIYRKLSSGTNREIVASKDFFSFSAGLQAEKRVSIRESNAIFRKQKVYETTYLGARLMFNLLNLQESNSTTLRGSAVTLSFCYTGWSRLGKK